ncbi:MAG: trigger factor [Muribaculaceae bacterium]|nr:trigger factor [Muribaculaceae bacterium]MBQ1745820.1 trigger factor [Muribaculaceae bacterium]
MNVNFEQIDAVNGMLTVELKREDFAADVNKEVAQMGVRHPLKGFRPGKAPKSLLMKFYGPSVTADVVDRMVGRAVYDYIRENKLQILGEPLPNEDTKVDIMKDEEMTFKYDLGMAPAIELKLNKRINVPYYNIEVTDQMIDDAIAHDRKRLGTLVDGEESDKESMLRGSMAELDEQGNDKENGIKVERTVISPRYMADDDEAAKFVGVKVGDTFTFNPHKAYNGNTAELSGLLNVDRADADVKSDFRITIEEIKVNKDAEMNEEFFKGVLGTETDVKDEAAFREAMRDMIAKANIPESNYRFTVDAQRILTDKAGEMPLPEEFLKRFLKLRREQDEKQNVEVTDEEAQNMFKQLRWQLVKDHLAQALEIKVEKEDIDTAAFIFAQQQLSQYGIYNAPEDLIKQQAERFMQDDRARDAIQEHALDNKFYAAVKEAVKVNEKSISVEDFRKLYEKDEK